MNKINAWISGRWAIPGLSGVLILASFAASKGYGAAVTGNFLMVAAAIVAEGSYGASPGGHCRRCPFADSCPASGRGEQVLR